MCWNNFGTVVTLQCAVPTCAVCKSDWRAEILSFALELSRWRVVCWDLNASNALFVRESSSFYQRTQMCISVGYSGKTCKTIAHFLNGIQQKRQCMWNSSDRTESKITHILKGLKQAHQMICETAVQTRSHLLPGCGATSKIQQVIRFWKHGIDDHAQSTWAETRRIQSIWDGCKKTESMITHLLQKKQQAQILSVRVMSKHGVDNRLLST